MNKKKIEFAGFWVRLFAVFIDYLTIIGGFIFLGVGFTLAYSLAMPIAPQIASFIWGIWTIIVYLWLVLSQVYFIYLHKKTGQTIGKKALGLKVIKSDGKELSWKDSIIRWFLHALFLLIFNLGFLWIAIDGKKQGLHDKVIKTYVIQLDEESRKLTRGRENSGEMRDKNQENKEKKCGGIRE